MRIFLILASLVFAVSANAATKGGSNLNIGIQGGLNFGDIAAEPEVPNAGSDMGLTFGVYAEYGLTDMFFVQPEVNFVRKGSLIDVDDNNFTDVNVNALEIPLLAKAKFDVSGFKPYLLAGPVVGFALSAKATGKTGGVEIPEQDIKDTLETFNFGLQFGAGVEFAIDEQMAVSLSGRYGLGLMNLDKPEVANESSKTRDILVYAGLQFAM